MVPTYANFAPARTSSKASRGHRRSSSVWPVWPPAKRQFLRRGAGRTTPPSLRRHTGLLPADVLGCEPCGSSDFVAQAGGGISGRLPRSCWSRLPNRVLMWVKAGGAVTRDLRRHSATNGPSRACCVTSPFARRGPCGLGHQRTAAEILLEPGAGRLQGWVGRRDDTRAAALSR